MNKGKLRKGSSAGSSLRVYHEFFLVVLPFLDRGCLERASWVTLHDRGMHANTV